MKDKAKRITTLAEIRDMGRKANDASRNREFEIYTLGDYLLACEYFPIAAEKYRAKHPDTDIDGDGGKKALEKIKAHIRGFVQTLPTHKRLLHYLVDGMDLKTLPKDDLAELVALSKAIVKQFDTNKESAKKPRKPTVKGLETADGIAEQVRKDYEVLRNTRPNVMKKVLYAELARDYKRSPRTIQLYLSTCSSAAIA